MKKLARTFAFLSAVSMMTIAPVTSSQALGTTTPVISSSRIPVITASGKISKAEMKYLEQAARKGLFVALMGKHWSILHVKEPALYQAMIEELKRTKGKIKNVKMTSEQNAMVIAMTLETLKIISAGQAAGSAPAPTSTPPRQLEYAEVVALGGCFGIATPMLAIPHPWSYISAGGVFVACMLVFYDRFVVALRS